LYRAKERNKLAGGVEEEPVQMTKKKRKSCRRSEAGSCGVNPREKKGPARRRCAKKNQIQGKRRGEGKNCSRKKGTRFYILSAFAEKKKAEGGERYEVGEGGKGNFPHDPLGERSKRAPLALAVRLKGKATHRIGGVFATERRGDEKRRAVEDGKPRKVEALEAISPAENREGRTNGHGKGGGKGPLWSKAMKTRSRRGKRTREGTTGESFIIRAGSEEGGNLLAREGVVYY